MTNSRNASVKSAVTIQIPPNLHGVGVGGSTAGRLDNRATTLQAGSSLTAADKATSWIPDKTMVWFANVNSTVPAGSTVQLTADRGLVLSDSQAKVLWWSASFSGTASNAVLNDTGNFVILGSDSTKVWDSFSNPSDTLLPTQTLDNGGVLYSKRSESNLSPGRFQLRLLQDGNLVLNSRDIPSNYAYDAYYISGTYDPSDASNSGVQVRFNQTGNMYIVRRNGGIFNLNTEAAQSSGSYYRATLEFDGVFVLYSHPKVFTGNPQWTAVWSLPENICIDLQGIQDSGACGFNSVCRLDDSGRPTCECPKSYSLIDPTDKYGSCKPSFIQSCADEPSSKEELYDFWELTDTDWPTSDYEQLATATAIECKRYCLNDCLCAVAIYRGGGCWKKKLPLSNGRNNGSVALVEGVAFIKYRKGDLPQTIPNNCKKDQGTLITAGSVLLGSSVVINIILVAAACFGYLCMYSRKAKGFQPGNSSITGNMRIFTYKELEEATKGFKDELGRGAFAIVYKGEFQSSSSSNISIAVKKLDRAVQEVDREFQTEVHVIAQTHQKNLVRLLGYCDDVENRLLVYEYMVNGTLASFIFGDVKPSWTKRKNIALGIARGLAYLHEECSKQIIHCDIKPQNILLDESYNARISDFGLAKLLMINQSRTNTGIRGTKGYVAPEWFRNTPVTVKVDVYSFGVLLLEIICCRRSIEASEDVEAAILTDWVWDCFEEGDLLKILENKKGMLDDWEKVETCVMVGIWCIQEDPSLRPSMKKVLLMLEGVVDVAKPPCPSPFSVIRS
ncbi:G-type lectin S-receptor-like serine/threonine-protein kinase LECRK3 [Daucus carota subsp. sativus]|uniref:G-type lectin S-receptor-like serine/threonine-protein kinase LECRK3 n=1 Tax=Daucus carota subsp. sativus TaxID=79200 RepID=UPI003083331C